MHPEKVGLWETKGQMVQFVRQVNYIEKKREGESSVYGIKET